jgi:hypothetical protein
MVSQHAKWLKVTKELPWRREIASLNFILSSYVWQQDHNGFTHQDPGFLNHIVTKKADKSAYREDTIDGRQDGVYLYAGYSSAAFTPIKKVKNRARVTGKVTTFNDCIQITDLKESEMELISENNVINPTEVTIEDLVYSIDPNYVHTLVKITNLTCTGGYTEKENDGSNGSYTVHAAVDGKQINLRFDSALKANYKEPSGVKITSHEYFTGKTLDVIGIVDLYNGEYQIKIISTKDIVIK